jgi:protein SCO1
MQKSIKHPLHQREAGVGATALAVCLFSCMLLFAGMLPGQELPSSKTGDDGIRVEERVGKFLPLDEKFRDEYGNWQSLRDFFGSDRPTILSLNYSNCPQMCELQLGALASQLSLLTLEPGQDYELVSISMSPSESAIRVRESKDKYVLSFGRDSAKTGWHFVTGKATGISEVSKAMGVSYRFVPTTKEYAHPPVFIVADPEGKILRYVHGFDFKADDLNQILVESKQGKTGMSFGEYLFACFMGRTFTGKNTRQVMQIMKLSGLITVIALIGWLSPAWFRRQTSTAQVSAVVTSGSTNLSESENDGTTSIVLIDENPNS